MWIPGTVGSRRRADDQGERPQKPSIKSPWHSLAVILLQANAQPPMKRNHHPVILQSEVLFKIEVEQKVRSDLIFEGVIQAAGVARLKPLPVLVLKDLQGV
jgi:hypothetical protein